jgi:hypothetical protein
LLSPASIRSHWVKHELMFALRQRRYVDRILPVVLRRCNVANLSWTLPAIQMVRLYPDLEAGCRDLLRTWGIGYVPMPSADPTVRRRATRRRSRKK